MDTVCIFRYTLTEPPICSHDEKVYSALLPSVDDMMVKEAATLGLVQLELMQRLTIGREYLWVNVFARLKPNHGRSG